ncbi:MAG: hypothetical protein HFJ59_02965 [Clostridia bacterium]|nr:hypothetical protein [Clostridia bacterium]
MLEQRKKGIFGKFSMEKEINKENEEIFIESETEKIGAFGKVGEIQTTEEVDINTIQESTEKVNAGTIRNTALPMKVGFWQKFKNFWLQEIDWNKEIKIELTPKQQKIEDEINEFLHQEITWEKVHDFLFKKVKFGKK